MSSQSAYPIRAIAKEVRVSKSEVQRIIQA